MQVGRRQADLWHHHTITGHRSAPHVGGAQHLERRGSQHGLGWACWLDAWLTSTCSLCRPGKWRAHTLGAVQRVKELAPTFSNSRLAPSSSSCASTSSRVGGMAAGAHAPSPSPPGAPAGSAAAAPAASAGPAAARVGACIGAAGPSCCREGGGSGGRSRRERWAVLGGGNAAAALPPGGVLCSGTLPCTAIGSGPCSCACPAAGVGLGCWPAGSRLSAAGGGCGGGGPPVAVPAGHCPPPVAPLRAPSGLGRPCIGLPCALPARLRGLALPWRSAAVNPWLRRSIPGCHASG